MKERSKDIDIIRGVAIVLMVFGHCIQYGNGVEFSRPEIFFNNKLFQVIYSFHMPLFMILSGYLFAFTVQRYTKITAFIKNRIFRLLVPIAGWQVITYFFYALHIEENSRWESNWLLSYVKSLPRELWFLWALFYCSVVVWIGKCLLRDSIFYYLLGWILTFFVPDIIYNLSYYKFMYPFFVGGYFFAQNEEILKSKLDNIGQLKTFLTILVTYLVLFLFWNYDSFIYTSGYTLLGRKDMLNQFGIDCYRTIVGFVGSIVVIMIIKMIRSFGELKCNEKSVVAIMLDAIGHIGEKSLGIYIISGKMVGIFLIGNLEKLSVNYFINVVQTIIIIGTSYLLTVILSKNQFTNTVLLGGRKAST